MCDMDGGAEGGFDVGTDLDVSEEIDIESSSDLELESSFEGMDDVSFSEELEMGALDTSLEPMDENVSLDDFDDLPQEEYEPDEGEDFSDDDDVKVLTREITDEVRESRERDTEVVLDNYRDNLAERGIGEEQIEEFLNQERDKINAEYASLDRGDTSSNIYYMPTDWDAVAERLSEQGDNSATAERLGDTELPDMISEEGENTTSLADLPDIEEVDLGEENDDSINEVTDELAEEDEEEIDENAEVLNEVQEMEINYDEIYEGLQQEALEQGFEDIDILADTERLDSTLENFEEDNWEGLSLDEQKEAMADLAEYVEETIDFKNPPQIEYYNNPREGEYGGYDPRTNTLHVNEYMMYNSSEAADTIAHELWHAYQHECAENPQSARDYQYQYNFENYISPDLGHEAYENQLVEAEARAFAAQFKGRLSEITGRSR